MILYLPRSLYARTLTHLDATRPDLAAALRSAPRIADVDDPADWAITLPADTAKAIGFALPRDRRGPLNQRPLYRTGTMILCQVAARGMEAAR